MRSNDVLFRRARLAAVALAAAGSMLLSSCSAPTESAERDAQAVPLPSRVPAPEDELSGTMQAELQAGLEQVMESYGVPGAAAGVWVPGEGSWAAASGDAVQGSGDGAVPVTTSMMWPLRSITKSYTVTLLLQLADQGRLHLDDTIDQYVDGVTNGDRITLRQLADMSSGNADYTGEAFFEVFSQDPERIFTLEELNGFVLGEPERFEPGTQKVYTNANTNLLGAVVEQVTEKPFEEVLAEQILDPLGQTGTRYLTDAADWAEPHATGYLDQDGTLAPQEENSSIFGAAGSLSSTLDDTRMWAQTLATGSLLSAETQAERKQGAPLDSGPPYGQYALGIGETNGWWGHNGEGIGFTSAAFHDPGSGATIVVFMNASGVPGVHPADETFRSFAEILARQT